MSGWGNDDRNYGIDTEFVSENFITGNGVLPSDRVPSVCKSFGCLIEQ